MTQRKIGTSAYDLQRIWNKVAGKGYPIERAWVKDGTNAYQWWPVFEGPNYIRFSTDQTWLWIFPQDFHVRATLVAGQGGQGGAGRIRTVVVPGTTTTSTSRFILFIRNGIASRAEAEAYGRQQAPNYPAGRRLNSIDVVTDGVVQIRFRSATNTYSVGFGVTRTRSSTSASTTRRVTDVGGDAGAGSNTMMTIMTTPTQSLTAVGTAGTAGGRGSLPAMATTPTAVSRVFTNIPTGTSVTIDIGSGGPGGAGNGGAMGAAGASGYMELQVVTADNIPISGGTAGVPMPDPTPMTPATATAQVTLASIPGVGLGASETVGSISNRVYRAPGFSFDFRLNTFWVSQTSADVFLRFSGRIAENLFPRTIEVIFNNETRTFTRQSGPGQIVSGTTQVQYNGTGTNPYQVGSNITLRLIA